MVGGNTFYKSEHNSLLNKMLAVHPAGLKSGFQSDAVSQSRREIMSEILHASNGKSRHS